jgi:hypothetical protein
MNKKETKMLKRTLHALELRNAVVPAIQNANSGFNRCSLCPKAFSTRQFLEAHETRRHGQIQTKNTTESPSEPKESKEFKKIVELIESFSGNLAEKERKEKIEAEKLDRKVD